MCPFYSDRECLSGECMPYSCLLNRIQTRQTLDRVNTVDINQRLLRLLVVSRVSDRFGIDHWDTICLFGGSELIPWPLDDRKYENLTGGVVMGLALGCYNESRLPLPEGKTLGKSSPMNPLAQCLPWIQERRCQRVGRYPHRPCAWLLQ